MPSVYKTPQGSDAMPEVIVKIIGGKHFRYLVEKPKIKHNDSVKTETQTALQKPRADNASQMSRDLPAPTDPTDQQASDNPDEEEESKGPDSDRKPENNQKCLTDAFTHRFLDGKISRETKNHCSSAPTGDRSLSYLHGLPRKTRRDGSSEHAASAGSGQLEDVVQKPSGMTKEDSFLLSVVRRELKSHPLSPSSLDKLQKELKTLDPASSGFLLQSQLSCLLLKHNIPLQLPTVKLLCQRFSRKSSSEMVDYGKFLWFLKEITSDDLQQKEPLVDSNPQTTQSHSDHRQSTAPQDSSSQSKVNMSLLEVLKMVLRTTNDKLNLENLSLSFRKEDRTFSGCLPLPKVRAICGKHGLCLTLSLLETLLSHQDLGYQGEIKWQKFVELLNRASELLCDLHARKSEAPATPGELDIPETSQSKAEHVKTPEEILQPENPPAETSAPQDVVSSLKIRPISQPSVSPAMKKDPGQHEIWIDRFKKLENALYLCDLSNTGVLEKERARRLIHNYNLIYNLSLSPRKIDQALRRFRLGENMLLEPALRYLKEL